MAEKTIFDLEGLYRKKFVMAKSDRIGAAGSCFARHLSANMRNRGYTIIDVEPAPSFLRKQEARDHGYGGAFSR